MHDEQTMPADVLSEFGKPGAAVNVYKHRIDDAAPTVMIVDDDPGVTNALSRRCQKLGVEVITANNGLQAILKAKRNFPHVMIVDINMPELDGFSVCEWVLNPDRPPMEVIVMTGDSQEDSYERCEAIGAFLVPKTSEAWTTISDILCEVLGVEPPASEPTATLKLKPKAPANVPIPETGTRILLVDDDPDILRGLEPRLRKLGASVLTARNGLDAYRIAAREQPQLIITDYMMPEAGGHYLVWRLRDNPATEKTPIFILSGAIGRKREDITWDLEFVGPRRVDRVFHKPIPFDELLEAILEACPMLKRENAGH